MRSSKSRSRSKSNRNRPSGNIVNRVFDSSGPEGKVRGTPQQVIDKYNQLARDAQLSGDRVAVENFQQHAEHYVRMLNEAQREMNERREQQDRDRQQNGGQQNNNQQHGGQPDYNDRQDNRQDNRQDDPQPDVPAQMSAPADVLGGDQDGSGLVETPENGGQTQRRNRRPRKKEADVQSDAQSGDQPPSPQAGAPEAAE